MIKSISLLKNFNIQIVISLLYICFIPITIKAGIQHDYIYYVKIWNLDQEGSNPYSILNPYGPLNIMLGKLILIDPIAPKIFMLINFAGALIFLSHHLKQSLQNNNNLYWFLLLFPLNPLFFYVTVIYGLNDTLVATLLIYAIIFKRQKRNSLAVLVLTCAALTKIYVLFIIPIFLLNKFKFDFKLMLVFITNFVAINTFCLIYFGDMYIYGLFNSISRGSSLLSPIDSLKNIFADGILFNSTYLAMNLIEIFIYVIQFLNPFFIFIIWLSMLRIVLNLKIDWSEASLLIFFVVFVNYKVVHPQFFLVLQIFIGLLLFSENKRDSEIAKNFLPIVVILSLIQLQFGTNVLGDQIYFFFYHYGGLIFYPISVICFFIYVKNFNQTIKINKSRGKFHFRVSKKSS